MSERTGRVVWRSVVVGIALITSACGNENDGDSVVQSPEVIQVPEPVLGQRAAMAAGDFSSCAVCHGARFQGNETTGAPALNRLPDWYIRDQLAGFRAGWRGANPEDAVGNGMYRTASLMSDETIEAAIAYFADFALTSQAPHWSQGADLAAATLYTERCANCHGAAGEGDETMKAPPLVGIAAWYMTAQLARYQSGWRGAAESDLYGQTMAASLEGLTDDEITALVNYVAAQ